VEELYDMEADPDNVVNLAGKPEHQQTLGRMRGKLREWQLSIHDSALLPEAERARRAAENKTTIYEMVRDPKLYDLPAYLDAADLALAKNPDNALRLVEFLKSPDSGLRYWGTVGLLMVGHPDAAAQAALEAVLDDPCPEVSAMASWVLIQSESAMSSPAGQREQKAPGTGASTSSRSKAQKALADLLQKHTPATLLILNILDWSQMDLRPFLAALDALPSQGEYIVGEEQRMVAWLRQSHGLPVPPATVSASEKQQQLNVIKDM
jgi:hypothetical protein